MKQAAPDPSIGDEIGSTNWYHTLELPGAPPTAGVFDLRRLPARALPDDLSGRRCLDACTASGFWAFEMEKRGAAEVVAIDIPTFAEQDWQVEAAAPARVEVQRTSFEIAHRALGSAVERHDLSVYDATTALVGSFDFVFIGAVLIHLRDPVRALRALKALLNPGGELRSLDVILLWSSILRPQTPRGRLHVGDDARWWTPNARGHRRWLEAADLSVTRTAWLFEPFGATWCPQRGFSGLNVKARTRAALYTHVGVPCQLAICS